MEAEGKRQAAMQKVLEAGVAHQEQKKQEGALAEATRSLTVGQAPASEAMAVDRYVLVTEL